MTDTQILTMAIALIVPLTAVWYNNKRLDDFRDDSAKRMNEFREAWDKRLDAMEKRIIERIDNAFEHMELLLKLHEAEHHKK